MGNVRTPQWVRWFTTLSSRHANQSGQSGETSHHQDDRQPLNPSHLSHSEHSRSNFSAPPSGRSDPSAPGGRSAGSWDQDFGFQGSQTAFGVSRNLGQSSDHGRSSSGRDMQHRQQSAEEEWSTNQLVWPGGEAPRLYSPWHQHVQPDHHLEPRVHSPQGRKNKGAAARKVNARQQHHVHTRYNQW